MIRRKKLTLEELIKKNKEELLRDRKAIEKIEKRLDEKHMASIQKPTGTC